MQRYLHLFIGLALLVLGALTVQAADFAWIEAESPTRSAVVPNTNSWGNTALLSGGKWLHEDVSADKFPADAGPLFSYDFTLPSAGNYEVWDRAGLPSLHQSFAWRIDGADWQDVSGTDYTYDVQRIEFWCEVGWWKIGALDLTAGKHTLDIRAKYSKDKDGKLTPANFGVTIDAFCIYQGHFSPNGGVKPDAPPSDADKQAAAQVFQARTPANNGERALTSLAGLWQVARANEQVLDDRTGPIKALPAAEDCHWASCNVPGNKNADIALIESHRLFFRTRINVPAEAAGKSFVLDFPCNSMITTVFVNGAYAGFTRAPYATWDVDITKFVKSGQPNEICVGIKDTYYARPDLDPKAMYWVPTESWAAQWTTEHFDFPVAGNTAAGMLSTPSLIVSGPAYAADVFAIPSVKHMQLTLETTLQNPGDKDLSVTVQNEILPLNETKAVKVFDPLTVNIPAGTALVAHPQAAWADAKLWWPDSPQQYVAVTKILVGGAVVDTVRTKFGFREWEWTGETFKLNGVPFHGHADTLDQFTSDPATIARLKKNGTTMERLWGSPLQTSPEMVDVYDAAGLPVRYTGIFDGMGGEYGYFFGGAPSLYAHWQEHLAQWVKEYRNHPSIFCWSMENEVTFINSRNWGQTKSTDPLTREAGKMVMSIDPTRPVMVDGGRALIDNSLPVYGCHYEETPQRDYPDEAYTLKKTLPGTYAWQIWPMDRYKPILMGESFYARGDAPSWFGGIMGEGAFSGRTEAGKGVGIFSKMLSEGYRWSDVNFHFCGGGESSLYYNSWSPVALLCRQWNWTFGSGEVVTRNLRVFNDTHYADPITAKWVLLANGKVIASESKVCAVDRGGTVDWDVMLTMPKVNTRTSLQCVLTCEVKGTTVFRDEKDVAVINPDTARKPALKAGELLVLDPNGSVKARLTKRGIPFTEVKRFEELPLTTGVVIVGKDALTPAQAAGTKLMSLAELGARVIVLEQTNHLTAKALPADLTFTNPKECLHDGDFAGRIAFPENPAHPIFTGLATPDFFTWSNDHIVYRNPYTKASHGSISLVQCDQDLGCSALDLCAVNNGFIMPCELVMGEKLASNAVAQVLFDNMLNYAASYQPIHKHSAVTMSAASPEGKLIHDSGLDYVTIPDAVEAISNPKIDIVIADADAPTMAKLAQAQAPLHAFTARGGYLMLWGLDEKGLADFNTVVGVQHMIRPFEMEKVTLPAVSDPLITGLATNDVVMESGEAIYGWAGDKFMANDIFTSVVDVDDVAPFSTIPDGKYFGYDDSKPGYDHWPRNMFNGFVSSDSWKYAFTIVPKRAPTSYQWTMTFPKEQEFTGMKILFTSIFSPIKRVNLYFDHDPKPFTYLVGQKWADAQTITLDAPRKATVVKLEFPDFANEGGTFGIDNMWMYVKRPEDFTARVKTLLNIGALVKYPMGAGGVILNNLRIQQAEGNPKNAQKKKNIVATLLRNLNATFTSGPATTTDIDCTPLELGTKCNAYLTHEKGWPEARDFSMLPKGALTLAGVNYNIRDFTTSPLPCCIMLGGKDAPAGLPNAVNAIPIGKKTEALFFLHTARLIKEWTPKVGEDTPPVVCKYVIHYADGTTETAPIHLGWDIDTWISTTPQDGKDCTVAWSTVFPNDDGKTKAVAYQYIWANPHPDIEITSVDLAYAGNGAGYAIPVLLGITAASSAK